MPNPISHTMPLPTLPTLPKPKPDSPPYTASSQPAALDIDVEAVAAHVLDTLLSYDYRDPQCDAARRYRQLGCPKPLPPSLCHHIASHSWPDPADMLDIITKGCRILGDDDSILLVRNPTVASPSGRPHFDDPVRIYAPLLARPHIIHAYYADASYH